MILFFDLSNGISGDMALAALLDTKIISEKKFLAEMNKLSILNEFELLIRNDYKNDTKCTKVVVLDNNELMQRFSKANDKNMGRNVEEVLDIVNQSKITDSAKLLSKKMFTKLWEAHEQETAFSKNVAAKKIAVDSIVKIVGTAVLIDAISPTKIIANSINTGRCFSDCEKGKITVPSQTTRTLLSGLKTYSDERTDELTTATGACIIRCIVDEYVGNVCGNEIACGFGGGEKNFQEHANVLKISMYSDESVVINKETENKKLKTDDKQEPANLSGHRNIDEPVIELRSKRKNDFSLDESNASGINIMFGKKPENIDIDDNEKNNLSANHSDAKMDMADIIRAIDNLEESICSGSKNVTKKITIPDQDVPKEKNKEKDIVEIHANLNITEQEELIVLADYVMKNDAIEVWFEPIYNMMFKPAFKMCVLLPVSNLHKMTALIIDNCKIKEISYINKCRVVNDACVIVKDTCFGKVSFKRVEGKSDIPEFEDVRRIAKENNLTIRDVVRILLSQEGDDDNNE